MKKLVLLSLLSTAVAFQASANEPAKATEAAKPAPTAAAPAAAKTEAKAVELKDGTKVQVEGESVFVLDAKGEKKPAPDGTHEAKDGTKIETKDGKIVKK